MLSTTSRGKARSANRLHAASIRREERSRRACGKLRGMVPAFTAIRPVDLLKQPVDDIDERVASPGSGNGSSRLLENREQGADLIIAFHRRNDGQLAFVRSRASPWVRVTAGASPTGVVPALRESPRRGEETSGRLRMTSVGHRAAVRGRSKAATARFRRFRGTAWNPAQQLTDRRRPDSGRRQQVERLERGSDMRQSRYRVLPYTSGCASSVIAFLPVVSCKRPQHFELSWASRPAALHRGQTPLSPFRWRKTSDCKTPDGPTPTAVDSIAESPLYSAAFLCDWCDPNVPRAFSEKLCRSFLPWSAGSKGRTGDRNFASPRSAC